MSDLNPHAVLGALLNACSGAPLVDGLVGPGTWVGARPVSPPGARWLGLTDLREMERSQAELLAAWITEDIGPLLVARNVLLARPWLPGDRPELTPTPILTDFAPADWFDYPQRVLLWVPGTTKAVPFGQIRQIRNRVLEGPPEFFWARSFDTRLAVVLATLEAEPRRARLKASLSAEDRAAFPELYDLARVEFLDDLVGARGLERLEADAALRAQIRTVDQTDQVLAAVANHIRVRRQRGGYEEEARHCGAVQLAPAGDRNLVAPPVSAKFLADLDAQSPDLLEGERELVWIAHHKTNADKEGAFG